MASVRGTPQVDVEFVTSMKARTANEVNTWDSMGVVFQNFAAPVGGGEIVDRTGGGNPIAGNKKTEGVPLVSRRIWEVDTTDTRALSSLVCLGPYAILRPQCVTSRPTRLVAGEVQTTYIAKETDVWYKQYDRSGGTPPVSPPPPPGQPAEEVADPTTVDKVFGTSWSHIDKRKVGTVRQGQTNATPVQRIWFQPTPTQSYTYLQSVFALRQNQPFGVLVRFYELESISSEVQEKLKANWDALDAGTPSGAEPGFALFRDFIPKSSRLMPAVILQFGIEDEYALVFYHDRSVSLFMRSNANTYWTAVGHPQHIKTTGYTIVYPIGSCIYLFAEDEIPMKPGRIPAATFQLDRWVNTGGGKVMMTLYGGGECAFAPVTHVAQGGIVSPEILVPFTPGGDGRVQCVFVGKKGSETYPSDVELPAEAGSALDGPVEYTYETAVYVKVLEKKLDENDQELAPGSMNPPKRIAARYKATFVPGGTDDPDDRIYSPAVTVIGLTYIPADVSFTIDTTPKISQNDVQRVSVVLGVENSTAEVVLQNRPPRFIGRETLDPPLGNYTPGAGRPSTTGMKPIRISAVVLDPTEPNDGNFPGSAKGNEYKKRQIFYGYTSKRPYHRSSPGSTSQVVLSAQDRMVQLRETYCFNVPIMDGMCHLAAFYLLCKEAGVADDDICLWQNPYALPGEEDLPENKVLLIDVIDEASGGPGSAYRRDEGCWAGHVEAFPGARVVNNKTIQGDRLHMTLPLSQIGAETPFYDFKSGTGVYEAIQKIREHSFFYLYANHFGNFVYSPQECLLQPAPESVRTGDDDGDTSRGRAFVEVDRIGDYNEYQRDVEAVDDMAEVRDGVYVMGVVRQQDGSWQLDVHMKAVPNWPNNADHPAFRPYRRFILIKRNKWNDPTRNRINTENLFLRHSRRRLGLSMMLWGQPNFFPYEVFVCDERHANELGIDGTVHGDKKFIMSQVKHDFDAMGTPGLTWWSQIVAEQYYVDPTAYGGGKEVTYDNVAGRRS